jgi:hypothetical protein
LNIKSRRAVRALIKDFPGDESGAIPRRSLWQQL